MRNVFRAIGRYLRQTDLVLMFAAILASVYGLVLVLSATNATHTSSRTMVMQILCIVIGIAGMVVISRIDYHDMLNWWKVAAVAGVVALLLPYVHPYTVSGSADLSWINLGFTTVQPAEFVKLCFILTFAKHFDTVKDRLTSPLNVILLVLHAMVPIGIIVVQQDMGMAFVFAGIFVFMLFASGTQLRYFALGAVCLLAGTPIIWSKVFGNTQRHRILALFDPENSSLKDVSLQQLYGRSAIGSGELWGYGLFHGPRTQSPISGQLPERQNDMIFAVAGEELGFIGCIVILLLFLVLLVRLLRYVRMSKDPAGSMICIGVFSAFAMQIFINVGMVLMVLPVIGITLPFFSAGGSSMIASYWLIGLALSVYIHRKNEIFAGKED
ncbi:FtsW/RodA/SpoVE family cell cycle protein [Ethanoligenens harbinense]|uniref:Cell cycle protein n=1 Tax=Ethanoligenens harbinense (strain DSM 18485 / JCM 12961 / CGMCC 1.5033 / YUAN-3) TaxID=663278 RepID=E6U973_ETHHY|nr:FtsW/RodA/SpoVE family cell cycle protein [Ethanoligenens harbinense]ADU27232.1 cell cycle protein [Ethanoligenens harbinense YUAN-3]AVQ96300.1 rod shape-determining protein RodA [Ethanoligenens harbinense YUAN-3]AYF38959.1 rod shape-determining protein RodA [Ethanoligenens harbinense]AYF41711.1 rod shape-determining protein RodA [Ethanoligenens harbinense]QCN92541.1 rod shape-determining protein RodA [Ethanoligenens harbinense]